MPNGSRSFANWSQQVPRTPRRVSRCPPQVCVEELQRPGSTAYQMRSVAVPFGNCIEPSNVKAGGKACPIRFQCAGCGFYRRWLDEDTSVIRRLTEPAANLPIKGSRLCADTQYRSDWAAVTGTAHAPRRRVLAVLRSDHSTALKGIHVD